MVYKLSCQGMSLKILRIIEALYKSTNITIWNGQDMSTLFEITQGVKQGCLMLSLTLFKIFLNDLEDELSHGVYFGGYIFKLFMYADDLFVLADPPSDLQKNIDQIEKYCYRWGLKLNLSKSKVMVFRNGGSPAQNEKWAYNQKPTDVVNSCKYIGVDLAYNMSFRKHLKSKLSTTKAAINTVWSNLIANSEIPLSAKFKVFEVKQLLGSSFNVLCV